VVGSILGLAEQFLKHYYAAASTLQILILFRQFSYKMTKMSKTIKTTKLMKIFYGNGAPSNLLEGCHPTPSTTVRNHEQHR